MNDKILKIIKNQIRKDVPDIRTGDTIKIGYKIREGGKERIQTFEGIVMKIHEGLSKMVTVRKMSSGIGVERIFPINSPLINNIEIVRKGKVRRANLSFLRGRTKKYKIKERKCNSI